MSEIKNKYIPERGVPDCLKSNHIGTRVLFRIPGQATISEGVVEEFTKDKLYVKIGSRWLRNDKSALAILPKKEKKRRSTPYE